MFDIGFMELMLISVVALIVIGPERLPAAIRTATLWIGRAKRSFTQVKSEIEREINADDIKRQLHNESILSNLKKVKDKADTFVADTKKQIDDVSTNVNATLKNEEEQLKESLGAKPKLPDTADATPPTAKPRETPAAAIDDPATLDDPDAEKDSSSPETDTPKADAESDDEPKKEEGPAVDFYNNPPSGTIKVEGAGFHPTSSLDDETDSGRRS